MHPDLAWSLCRQRQEELAAGAGRHRAAAACRAHKRPCPPGGPAPLVPAVERELDEAVPG